MGTYGEQAVLFGSKPPVALGTLGGSYTNPYAINNNGQVVGESQTASGDYDAFLYSGTMVDLGLLVLDQYRSTCYALGINRSGQVVGYCLTVDGDQSAFLYSGGTMMDLNDLASLPRGTLTSAVGINDYGQIVANGEGPGYGEFYLLVAPWVSPFTVLNPFAAYAALKKAPPTLNMPVNMPAVLNSPAATRLAADGESAVVLAYQSKFPQPVTFAVSASGTGLPSGTAVGSLGQFDANYLVSPNPAGGNVQRYQVEKPTSGPDAGGNYVFLALLWSPSAMPVPNVPLVNLTVAATQALNQTVQASIALEPPPLLLVHGIWSSAAGAGFSSGSHGFNDWISAQYPHNLIYAVDYGSLSSLAFSDPGIQARLLSGMTDALADAAAAGMAARTVDVFAHSMGGLVTRYLLSSGLSSPAPDLLSNPVHQLITVGTPHSGSKLATTLDTGQGVLVGGGNPFLLPLCLVGPCTLGGVMAAIGRPVGTGTQSLEPGSSSLQALSATNAFQAIVGDATGSPESVSEELLDILISAFLPGLTVANVLNEDNDTIVGISSQGPSGSAATTIPGIVHANLCGAIAVPSWLCPDVGETQSTDRVGTSLLLAHRSQRHRARREPPVQAPGLLVDRPAARAEPDRVRPSGRVQRHFPARDGGGPADRQRHRHHRHFLHQDHRRSSPAANCRRPHRHAIALRDAVSLQHFLYADSSGSGELRRHRRLQRQYLRHDGAELHAATQRHSVRPESAERTGSEHERGELAGDPGECALPQRPDRCDSGSDVHRPERLRERFSVSAGGTVTATGNGVDLLNAPMAE